MAITLLLLALLQAAAPCPNTFANPPKWPSFLFLEMDDEAVRALTLTRNGVSVVDLPEGVIVLGSVATMMPDGTVIRAWTYTREDKSTSSRLLHGDALVRLYGDVVTWLEAHPRPPKHDESTPRTRVSH